MAKRRAAGEGMLRRRGKRWEARIVIGHAEDGKPIFHHISGKTQKEALAKLRQALDDYHDVELSEDSRITLKEWLERWMEEYMSVSIRESTLKGCKTYIKNYIVPHLGDRRIDKLTTHDIQQFYIMLREEGRLKEDEVKGFQLAAATVRRIHGVLRQAMQAATDLRMIPRNPIDGVKLPKIDNDAMKILNEDELKTFKEAIKEEPEWYDFFYTEITTGMRKGEICGLMWSDFDSKTGTLHVRRTLHRYEDGQLRTGETKTGAGKRKILLPRSTAQLLRERSKKSYSQWIFWNPIRPEEPVAPDSAYLAMKRILKKAGLPDIRFHDLRHPYVKHTTKIFSLRLKVFQAQPVPDALRKTRGAFLHLREGGNHNPFLRSCNRKLSSRSTPQSKMSLILYAISMRLSGYTSTLSMRRSVSSAVRPSELKTALAASCRLSCRACSSCFCFACANTTA